MPEPVELFEAGVPEVVPEVEVSQATLLEEEEEVMDEADLEAGTFVLDMFLIEQDALKDVAAAKELLLIPAEDLKEERRELLFCAMEEKLDDCFNPKEDFEVGLKERNAGRIIDLQPNIMNNQR